MSTNFRIFEHRNSENLHLKLMGEFDGTSALELINILENNCDDVNRIIIHTNSLDNIYPFGRDVFKKNLKRLNGISQKILFTGEKPIHNTPEYQPSL